MSGASAARLFFALPLGRELGARVREGVAQVLDPRTFRLARAQGLHATLFFFGETPRARIPELLAAAGGDWEAPRLMLRHTGAFPGWNRARVLWVGVEERSAGALAACHAELLTGLERLGIDTAAERARPFRPHVTVARQRRPGAVPEAFRALTYSLAFEPEALVLYSSSPAAGGSEYHEEGRIEWR